MVIGQRLFRPWADDLGERGSFCRSDGWGPRVPPYTWGLTRQPKRMLAKRAFMADQCAPGGLDVLLEELYSTRPKAMRPEAAEVYTLIKTVNVDHA